MNKNIKITVNDDRGKCIAFEFTVGNVTYAYSSDYPEGQVMEQQYGSGTSLEKGTSVSIVISKGAEPQEPEEPSDNEEDE